MTKVTAAMIARLRAFEGSDELGNGDFSVCDEAAVMLEAALSAIPIPATTNGDFSEPRQTHCADPDCTGPKPHIAGRAGCKGGNPRAASDDEVERAWTLAASIMVAVRQARFPKEYFAEAHDEFEATVLVPLLLSAIIPIPAPTGVIRMSPVRAPQQYSAVDFDPTGETALTDHTTIPIPAPTGVVEREAPTYKVEPGDWEGMLDHPAFARPSLTEVAARLVADGATEPADHTTKDDE